MGSLLKEFAKKSLPLWAWNGLRVARTWWDVHFYSNHTVSHNYGGFPFRVLLADSLGEGWYDHDWPELPEIALLKRGRLKPGARVFDLGAHQCVVAMMLAKIVGPDGRVVALEANRHNAEIGERNRSLNRITNLHVMRGAAARESGTITFNRGLNGKVDSGNVKWGRTQVPAFSVDDLARTHGTPSVLFIDVEGFECEVLRGACETLSNAPDIFVEVHTGCGLEDYGDSRRKLYEVLSSNRYALFAAQADSSNFVEVHSSDELPEKRFFLVATTTRLLKK
jgi:FkbM family methyltransferase